MRHHHLRTTIRLPRESENRHSSSYNSNKRMSRVTCSTVAHVGTNRTRNKKVRTIEGARLIWRKGALNTAPGTERISQRLLIISMSKTSRLWREPSTLCQPLRRKKSAKKHVSLTKRA